MRAVRAARELGLPAGRRDGRGRRTAPAPVVTRAVELARGRREQARRAHPCARPRASAGSTRRSSGASRGARDAAAAFAAAREAAAAASSPSSASPGIGKTRLARELALRDGDRARPCSSAAASPTARARPSCRCSRALHSAAPEHALAGEPTRELVLARLARARRRAEAGAARRVVLGRAPAARGARADAAASCSCSTTSTGPSRRSLDLVDYLRRPRPTRRCSSLCLARPELERPLGRRRSRSARSATRRRVRSSPAPRARRGDARADRRARRGQRALRRAARSFAAEGGEGLPPTLEARARGPARPSRPLGARSVLQRARSSGASSRSARSRRSRRRGRLRDAARTLARGFVHPAAAADPGDDGYRFHHVLLRDAAYARLTKADRAALHERAAAWLDRDGPGDDAIVGYHLEQAVALPRASCGEDADELAPAAGERLGEAGMRVLADERRRRRRRTCSAARRACCPAERATGGAALGTERSPSALARSAAERRRALASAERSAAAARALDAGSGSCRAERTLLRLLSGRAGARRGRRRRSTQALPVLERAGDDRGLGRASYVRSPVALARVQLRRARGPPQRSAPRPTMPRAGFSPAAASALQAEALYLRRRRRSPTASTRCTELLERAPGPR